MELAWEPTVTEKFWIRLRRDRVTSFLGDREFLRSLRFQWDELQRLEKAFAKEFAERETTLAEAVLKACQNLHQEDKEHAPQTKIV